MSVYKIIFPFVVCATLLLTNCKKKCEKPSCSEFSMEERNWMPNKENDTITFLSFNNKIKFIASAQIGSEYEGYSRLQQDCPDYCVKTIT